MMLCITILLLRTFISHFDQHIPTSSPSQTPVLVHDGHALLESTAICEYLDEAFPDTPKLMPAHPLHRARTRSIAFEIISSQISPLFFRMFVQPDKSHVTWPLLRVNIKTINDAMCEASEGPYWFGSQFTLADVALFPLIDRCELPLPATRATDAMVQAQSSAEHV